MSVGSVLSVSVLLGLVFFFYQQVSRPPGPGEWGRTPKWAKRFRIVLASIPLILGCLGDYISGNGRNSNRIEPEVFAPQLKGLHAPLGVYSVLGNYDWWHNGRKVRHALEQNGLRVLDDEVVEIQFRGTTFWLAGLADLWTRPQRVEIAGESSAEQAGKGGKRI